MQTDPENQPRSPEARKTLEMHWRGIPLRCTRTRQGWQSLTRESDDLPDRDGPSRDHPLIRRIERQIREGWELDESFVDLTSCTEFTRSVLRQTARIPPGSTRSYGEIARELGTPGAARAVGQALRRNPLPLLIPCHRVIRSDGSIGGYGGRNRSPFKRVLLDLETTTEDSAKPDPA